jgi:protein-tyrosine phosphatase
MSVIAVSDRRVTIGGMTEHPDRVLPLQGASNFRDLGGYPADGGRPVRWRRLFRSDHLGDLSEEDKGALGRLGLARAFDLRGERERAAHPYALPGVRQHLLAIEPVIVQSVQAMASEGRALTVPTCEELMRDLYRRLVDEQAHRFAELLDQLVHDDTPAVFHCTAGKDRTGFAAAVILLALGVPRTVVMDDYLLTNRHFKPPVLRWGDIDPEVLAVMWRVQQDFLEASLQRIDQAHGGFDRYLGTRLGFGAAAQAALRERYLQPA